jgi:hypothetical protein
MLNILMQLYTHGSQKNVFTKEQLQDWKQKFQLNTITKTSNGDNCWGIDKKCLSYAWLKKTIMPIFSEYFNKDLKLIFGSYIDCFETFPIHTDIKDLPEGATGNCYVSILIPHSIDNEKNNFSKVSTEFFDKDRQITDWVNWEENSFIWWESQLNHKSSDFKKQGIVSKQYFIFHTYV